MLATQPVAELVHDLRGPQHDRQQESVVDAEELVKLGQFRAKGVEFDRHQSGRREGQHAAQEHRYRRKEPTDLRVEPGQKAFGVEPLEADAEHVAHGRQQHLPFAFVAALAKLMPLAGHVGDHQSAAVQHSQELLQFFEGDLLRRKLGLESLLDLVQADLCRRTSSEWRIPLPGSGSSPSRPDPSPPSRFGPNSATAAQSGRAASGSATCGRNWRADCL